jgi:hypothetical protein
MFRHVARLASGSLRAPDWQSEHSPRHFRPMYLKRHEKCDGAAKAQSVGRFDDIVADAMELVIFVGFTVTLALR